MVGAYLLVAILLLPLLLLLVKHFKGSRESKFRPLPPGPYPWPVLGNILQMGNMPHISLTHLAQIHGPLFCLKLGHQLVVVGSSKVAATEILKNHDRNLSGRFVPDAVPASSKELNSFSIGWARECDDNWKSLRALCRKKMFSNTALESQAWRRQKSVIDMISFIRKMEGKVIKIRKLAFAVTFNMLSNILVSKILINLEHENDKGDICRILRELVEVASAPNLSDLYPVLRRFDLNGRRKKNKRLYVESVGIWSDIIHERRKDVSNLDQEDFLTALIRSGSSDDQINLMLMEMLVAGSDTSSSTIEWTLAELMKHPESLKRVQEEMAKEIDQDKIIKESDLPQLAYLQACVKETLRLHPPAPFLLPHRAVETCEVMNYSIPKNSQVLINVWAIGRDSAVWDDPSIFTPERFLQSKIDYKGNDFECIPFGAGRRICPGLPLASRFIPLVVASVLHFFDWSLPDGNNPTKLGMEESYGITIMKKEPLLLVPKTRN